MCWIFLKLLLSSPIFLTTYAFFIGYHVESNGVLFRGTTNSPWIRNFNVTWVIVRRKHHLSSAANQFLPKLSIFSQQIENSVNISVLSAHQSQKFHNFSDSKRSISVFSRLLGDQYVIFSQGDRLFSKRQSSCIYRAVAIFQSPTFPHVLPLDVISLA